MAEDPRADRARSTEEQEPKKTDGPDEAAFERLLIFLKESRALDLTGYKRPSLRRRVRHRMRELGIETFDSYQDRLQLEPGEFTALFNTVLINVTSFFRDPDVWEHLRTELLPELIRSLDGAPLRVWSAGASAGQEAYTLAMLLHELMGEQFREQVKIYATDVDEEALDHARQASYSEREIEGLPAAYRDRYFDVVDDRFVISAELRRNVIFGRNDLTRDAPISRIHILTCRNTLMYFNAETQARVINRLGFAPRSDGVFVLGKSEMLLNHTAVFDPVDLGRRIFRRVGGETGPGTVMTGPRRTADRVRPVPAGDRLHSEILLTNPMAQIAVDTDGRLVMINHRASGMLGISDRDLGRPFQDLEVSYRPLELRAHLAEATEKRVPVLLREVEWRRSGPDPVFVDVHVVPLLDAEGEVKGASISFSDVTRFRALRVEVELANRQLERAYEELQSTNEELETTNEEIQSTNEELETVNEELQSSNDELQSTVGQLGDRTLEVSDLAAFMGSILGSLETAVIVLDQDLVVTVWTRQAYDLWGLRAEETVGCPLLTLDSGLPSDLLLPWIQSVITGEQESVVGQRVPAVNRRGRPVELQVTVTSLQSGTEGLRGVLIAMEEQPPPSAESLPAG